MMNPNFTRDQNHTPHATYTAEFTVTEGGTDIAAGTDITTSFTMDDAAGNTSSTFSTAISQAGDDIDANTPTIASVSIPNSSMIVGDTVTATINVGDDGGTSLTNLSGSINGFALSSLSEPTAPPIRLSSL